MRKSSFSSGLGLQAPASGTNVVRLDAFKRSLPIANDHPRPIVPTKRKHKTRAQRFMAKVDASGGIHACHLWTAAVEQANGYGMFRDANPHTGTSSPRGAHVVAWEIANNRPVPRGMNVLHARGCISRLCVNPRHLRVGTKQQNTDDAMAENRGVGIHKLSPAKAVEIRDLQGQMTRLQLAELYGVSVTAIRDVLDGRTYRLYTGIVPKQRIGRQRDGGIG